jgi:hypothetical protein
MHSVPQTEPRWEPVRAMHSALAKETHSEPAKERPSVVAMCGLRWYSNWVGVENP